MLCLGAAENDEVKEKEDGTDTGSKRKNRQLHRTSSIFLRTVAAHVKKEEIEELCKRFPGYLRVGLADPNPGEPECH